ncbi:MAG TPA: TOMM precursor leader peptide-binding protein [Kofleriaceae bacterium]|jgi:bacteriocin biosynthesis cyclodehydratase domain-containing protein|nr:TOMM precursor leader peptide-binding protein [Kofleriaceae bacterium]
MELDIKMPVYRAVPVRVIDHENGVILKRGALETRVQGDGARDIVRAVLALARAGATRAQLHEPFAAADQPAVDHLVDQLVERHILVRSVPDDRDETPETILYWELDTPAAEVKARLAQAKLAIIGVNEISLELVRSLRRSGFEHCPVIDYPILRNRRLYQDDTSVSSAWSEAPPLRLDDWKDSASRESIDCVIATCDHGGLHWLRHWNEVCVANRLPFYPVALRNHVGQIGPYVVPGETACYECLRARQNSHLADPAADRAAEMVAFDAQDLASYHPAMPPAIAHVAAMQLVKVFGRILAFSPRASFIELNLLVPRLVTRRVLRIPGCAVCRTLEPHAPTSIDDIASAMPGNPR